MTRSFCPIWAYLRACPSLTAVIASLNLWFLSANSLGGQETITIPAWMEMDRFSLRVVVELASDAAGQEGERAKVLDQVYQHLNRVNSERFLTLDYWKTAPDPDFKKLIAADSEDATDYLVAIWRSYYRFQTARAADDREWMSKHLTAMRKYHRLAAKSLRRFAQVVEDLTAELKKQPFAVRRSPDQAKPFHAKLKRDGLSAEHRKLLKESGLQEKQIKEYETKVLATQPEKLGISIVELYTLIAEFRRGLADNLDEMADIGMYHDALANTFTVGNPHDKEETIDLFIRPVAIPPEWKLAVVDPSEPIKTPAAKPKEKPKKRVEEVVPGKHYRVKLPPKGEINVASVVQPVGEVGENTTARWAVEGKIGKELIGGMVHELSVPAYLPDLELPPVAQAAAASASAEPALPIAFVPPAEERSSWLWLAFAAAAVLGAGALLALLQRLRRKGA